MLTPLEQRIQRLLRTPEIGVTSTTLRDAPQSLWATRMPNPMKLQILPVIDQVGYFSLEVWGGATFDVAYRFLGEDPWVNLDRMKQAAPNTPLQMLLRGQNGVGYQKIPNDVLRALIEEAHQAGIDIFRIFDAMNDTRNLANPVRFVRGTGAHCQVCVSYTESEIHTPQYYVEFVQRLVRDSLLNPNALKESFCIKDMAGIAKPQPIFDIVKELRRRYPNLLIHIHSHYSSGVVMATYLKAVEAGANAVDAAISSMSHYTSQPAAESVLAMFEGSGFQVNLRKDLFSKIRNHFLPHAEQRHLADRKIPVDADVLEHKIPGGMWTNYLSQLEQMGLKSRIDEVLKLFPVRWRQMGYPPLVTPTSQIVGNEVALTILLGEGHHRSEQVRAYFQGEYGKPVGEVDPDLQEKVLGHRDRIDHDGPNEIPQDGLDAYGRTLMELDLYRSRRDAVSYAIFPEPVLAYLNWREGKGPNPREKKANDPSIAPSIKLERDFRGKKAFYERFIENLGHAYDIDGGD